jgi:hypothetical protein
MEGSVKARIAASVVLAAGLLLGTSGCAFFAPQSTLIHYDPSDGIGIAVGNVKVRNALLLTKDGETASLLINFINDGTKPVDLLVQYKGTKGTVSKTIHLSEGQVKTYGSDDTTQFVIHNMGTKAGELFPIFFQYGDHTGKQGLVPVLDGSWSTYKGLLPSPTPTITIPPTNIPGETLNPTNAVTPPPVTAPTPTPTPTK